MKTLLSLIKEHKKALLLLFGIWGTYLFTLLIRAIEFKPDGLYAGHVNIWSDWSLHIGMAAIFAYKDPQYWFAYHPMYASGKFTYGFLTNFISGMLMRMGFSIPFSFITPSIIYIFFLLIGMYAMFYIVLQSKKQAVTAISIFFLSSGLGGLKFIRDVLNHYSIAKLLYPDPALDYTRLTKYEWYTGNVIGGMLVPQRAYLLGLTMSIWAIVGLLYVLLDKGKEKSHPIILIGSATLVGLLPITHMHSFIVMVIISTFLGAVAFINWYKSSFNLCFFYAIPAALLSITLYSLFIAGGIDNPNFMQLMIGWTAKGGWFGWLGMWLKIWGLMLPIATLGFFLLRKRPLLIQVFFLSFFAVFALPNLVLLQPTSGDNAKLLMWAYLGFSGLAAVALSWGWQQNNKYISRLDVVLVAVGLTFTGFLELVRIQQVERYQPQMTSREDINLGIEIREKTEPLALFLTAEIHNHPVMIWGVRPIVTGLPGWVRNYGFLPDQTEKDVQIMFKGGAAAETLLKQYKVSYVAIGPSEIHDLQANESFYSQKYSVAFSNKNYRIYDVRSLWSLK
jgi:hypothetical protein